MKKTLIYLVLLGFLGFGVYYFIFREGDGLYSEKDAAFTIRDTANIGRIFLARNNGETILLDRTPQNTWMIDKHYEAMPLRILNLLTCLNKQTALYPVSDREHNRIVKLMAGAAVKVELYDRNLKKIKSFYIAGNGPNFHGSYMMMEGSEKAYLVEVPGFDGYLTPRFNTDLAEWRSHSVFNLPPDSIRQIHVQYAEEPLSSFTLNKNNDKIDVEIDPALKNSVQAFNAKRAKEYTTFFSNVNSEGYLNGLLHIDSFIANSPKRCNITLTSVQGKTTSLDIYWMNINKRSKNRGESEEDESQIHYDIDRMYAIRRNTNDTLLIQNRAFEKLMLRSYQFFMPDDTFKKPLPSRIQVPMSPHHSTKS
jgi:hypothetical protein